MEIAIHKHLIEQCVMMACASKADRDKALWLTMAQSWGRLAGALRNGARRRQ